MLLEEMALTDIKKESAEDILFHFPLIIWSNYIGKTTKQKSVFSLFFMFDFIFLQTDSSICNPT